MDLLEHIWSTLKLRLSDFVEQSGLETKWQAFFTWRKIGQNNKIVQAICCFAIAVVILLIYACSQRPDL